MSKSTIDAALAHLTAGRATSFLAQARRRPAVEARKLLRSVIRWERETETSGNGTDLDAAWGTIHDLEAVVVALVEELELIYPPQIPRPGRVKA